MKNIALFLFLLPELALFAQTSLAGIDLPLGSYQVGYESYILHDSTRTYKRIGDWNNRVHPRPIHVSVWYPAARSAQGSKLAILDYFEILKIEEEWENLPKEFLLKWFYYADTPSNRNHLQEVCEAVRDADPEDGQFPLIIYAPSYQRSSVENFALCEFLASHGYVVFSCPSRGAENRYMEGATAKDLDAQSRDIEFLISQAIDHPQGDAEKLAVMGFSYGGMASSLTAMRNDHVKAVVSLDGSERYQFATLTKSPSFSLGQFAVPYMHLAQKNIPDEVLEADNIDARLNSEFQFYDSLRNSDIFKVKMHHMTHSYFSSMGVLFESRDMRQDKSDREIMQSYRWVADLSLRFLNGYLKEEKQDKNLLVHDFVNSAESTQLLTMVMKKGPDVAFTFNDFNELAAERKYQDIGLLVANIKEQHPSFILPEGKLNSLGLQMLFDPTRTSFGLDILKFACELYPESANLFDSLGEAYLFVGDMQNAKESFEESLRLYPDNLNAVERLKELRR